MEIPEISDPGCQQEDHGVVENVRRDTEGEFELEVKIHDEEYGGIIQFAHAEADARKASERSLWSYKRKEITERFERKRLDESGRTKTEERTDRKDQD